MSDIFNRPGVFAPGRRISIFEDLMGQTDRRRKTLEQRIIEQERQAQTIGIQIPETKEKIRLWDILEIARYPITNMIHTVVKEVQDPDERLEFRDIGKILKSAIAGATLQEKTNSEDVLKLLFPDKKPWFYKVFGLAGDILTDPLTYVTFGAAGGIKGSAAAKKAGTELTEGLAKRMGTKLGESLTTTAQKAFAKRLIKEYGGKSWTEAIQRAVRLGKTGGDEGIERAIRLLDPSRVEDVTKGLAAGAQGLRARIPGIWTSKPIVKGGRLEQIARGAKMFGAGKGTQEAIRQLPTTLKGVTPIRQILRAFEPAAKWGQAFKGAHEIELDNLAKAGVRLDDLKTNVKDIAKDAIQVIKTKPTEWVKEVTKGKKTVVHQANAMLDELAKLIDRGGGKVPQELMPISKKIREVLNKQFQGLAYRGLLDESKYRVGYIPRYYVQKRGNKLGVLKQFTRGSNASFRHAQLFTDLDEAIAAGFDPLSVLDSLNIYIEKSSKIMASHDITKEVLGKFGRKVRGGKKGSANLIKLERSMRRDGYEWIRPGEFTDWIAPDDIAGVLNEMEGILMDPDELVKIGRYFDKLNNFFKRSVTVWQPGYHGRNFLSNMWTMVFKDGVGPRQANNMKKAWSIFRNADPEKAIKYIRAGKSVQTTVGDLHKLVRELNVHTGKFQAPELIEAVSRGIGKDVPFLQGAKAVLGAAPRLADAAGGFTGSAVENVSRIASWLNDVGRGLDDVAAASRVKRFFLDYSDLSQVEQKFRKIISFYSWLKKNMVLQVHLMLQDPGKYSALTIKPLRALNSIDPEEMQWIPDWMKERMFIQIGNWTKDGQPVLFDPNLPFQDLGKIDLSRPVGSAIEEVVGGVSPIYKTPMELLLNKEFFRQKPIEYNDFDLREVPPMMQPLMYGLPEAVRERLKIRQDEGGVWRMPAKWAYAIASLLPITRTGQMIQRGVSPGTPDYQRQQIPFTAASRTLGLKFRPTDIEYYKEQALKEKLQGLLDLNAYGRKYGQSR